MKIYKAGDELVNILLKHGFIERTARSYFRDAQTLDPTTVYDPDTMRRVFTYKRFYYNRILFEQGNIKVLVNNGITESSGQFTELELHSILAFFSLKNTDRWVFVDKTEFKPSELHLYYANCVKHLGSPLTNPFEKKIIKAFESIVV
jgi:hypothetical protein